jgi:hypothetical protein
MTRSLLEPEQVYAPALEHMADAAALMAPALDRRAFTADPARRRRVAPAARPRPGGGRGWISAHAAVESREESDQILAALHAKTQPEFDAALAPLLSPDEREALRAAQGNALDRFDVYERIVERLTFLWANLNGWPTFARVVERPTALRLGLNVLTLELNAPSRGLEGRVAFRVEHDLSRVRGPIPRPVLDCVAQTWRTTFVKLGYLEPLFSRPRAGADSRVLRSIREVCVEEGIPIDPLVVGWLGAGPGEREWELLARLASFLRTPAPLSPFAGSREHVFLIGHWD